MMQEMVTYRMVAETPDGLCAVDVVLRGQPKATEHLIGPVVRFLDHGCGSAGDWVDNGTRRLTYTVAVEPGPEYDYNRQAWVVDGLYVRCGHPEDMDCGCYGRAHEGEAYQPA